MAQGEPERLRRTAVAQLQLPRIDAEALRERVRDVDLSRLADLGEELRRLDLGEGIRSLDVDAIKRLDLDQLRHLGDGLERPEIDLAPLRDSAVVRRVQRALGREPKRNLWSSLPAVPTMGATVLAGAMIVLAGAAIGGVVAWLYQPGKGEQRRAEVRRRLGRIRRKAQRALRPAA
jgi:hypothetical protein